MLTDSVAAAFAARGDVVARLCETAVAVFYGPSGEGGGGVESTTLAWVLAGELSGGDAAVQRQIFDAALGWGMRQVPAVLDRFLASAAAAPLCDAVAAVVATEECVLTEPAAGADRWMAVFERAVAVAAAHPGAVTGFAAGGVFFGSLARARERALTAGACPKHCELVLWLAGAVYRSADARWTVSQLGSGNGWVLTDHHLRIGDGRRITVHFDRIGAQEYVLAAWRAARLCVIGRQIAAGQNLKPITGRYLRYLIAVDVDTGVGVFLVPGDFTEVEYKACCFEALSADLAPTLQVHSNRRLFDTDAVVWRALPGPHPTA
ncbi:hypothetical protein ACQP2U_42390 (plasmid) [Nocardia sp. CA-084685]|uniref:hypothetical protein n=1 Tax=Nocardia sp. CA-084685 TaxID=3239970 RepID=UPI003D95AFF7